MKAILLRNLVRPLTERLGTALAVWLLATGWDTELVNQFVTALCGVVLIAADLVFARLNREDD